MIRRAFTLVELLVVITIIGLLVGLLLPAVMSARESGRRAQCANNLKQLGSACLQHEEGQGYYPSGGWGGSWVGDTTLGYGRRQPGSWLYSILPNLDQDSLYRLAGSDGTTATAGNQMAGAQVCIGTALPFMNCPSRRRAVPYPSTNYKPAPINVTLPSTVGRGDYAANAGNESDAVMMQTGPTATNFRAIAGNVTTGNVATSGGLALSDANWQAFYTTYGFVAWLPNGAGSVQGEPNGVIYTGSQIRKDDIIDGTTNTILLGEKFLNPNNYSNGLDKGDSKSMYSGCSFDNERTTYGLNGMSGTPIRDRSEITNGAWDMFGSAHVDICCFAFCDGSVHWIKYSIDVPTYQCLGCRNDGLTVDTSGL